MFVKGFKVRLWDYTNLRGNILGVICPPQFSLIWLAVDVIYYYALGPFIFSFFETIFHFMFETESNGQMANIIAIFLLGILYGVFLIDFIMSLGLFSKIRIVIQGSTVIHCYESIRDLTKKKILENKIKIMGKIPKSFKAKNQERKQKEAAFKNS